MSEMKWTPGPWRVDPDLFLFRGYTQITGANHYGLAQVVTRMEDEDESDEYTATLEANARLIASSPDLYDALQAAFEYLDAIPETTAGGDDEAVRIARQARAALAKARGE
jgi:hypothetical protein